MMSIRCRRYDKANQMLKVYVADYLFLIRGIVVKAIISESYFPPIVNQDIYLWNTKIITI